MSLQRPPPLLAYLLNCSIEAFPQEIFLKKAISLETSLQEAILYLKETIL